MFEVGKFLLYDFDCMGSQFYTWSEDEMQLVFREDVLLEDLIKNAIACLQSIHLGSKEEEYLEFLQKVRDEQEANISKNTEKIVMREDALQLKAHLLQKMHENNIKQLFYQ